MSQQRHGHPHFFKFASAESACKVIETKSLKWSSAIEFNDPFDHHAGFVLDVDEAEFAELLTDSVMRVIFSNIAVGKGASLLFTNMLLRMRQMREHLSRSEIRTQLEQSSVAVARNLRDGISGFSADIRTELLNARVFCVTEDANNVVMWSHYADQHRGVVFQLGCVEHLDNRLLAAKQVQYSDQFIAFPNADEYAKHLTAETPIDFAALVWRIAYVKHRDWSYEREWRVHIPLLGAVPTSNVSFFDEPQEVFQKLIVGCRMPREMRDQVVALARAQLPNMQVLQARMAHDSFRLQFDVIDEV